LTAAELPTLADIAEELRRRTRNKIERYYPDTGPLRRELYPKNMAFFAAGAIHRERAALAGNRVGKTEAIGGYETVLHLTGRYPAWWVGKRFDHAIRAWAAGDTSKTTREILQTKILGAPGRHGTGLIPADCIVRATPKPGVPEAVETIYVRHSSGGVSSLTLKSYDQGRRSFQGTEQDLILLDEEPPEDILVECTMRTMETGAFAGGIILLTFTPLLGWTEVVNKFLSEGERTAAGRFVVQATWDDVPHLSQKEKDELWATLPPHQRAARSKGTPDLGGGAIYPISEEEITVTDFALPAHWPRLYGLDVGWNWTAAIHLAWDRDKDVVYFYREYLRGEAEPAVHVAGIQAPGKWIPGVIDPAANASSQFDGRKLIQGYRKAGLVVVEADNAVEAGIYETWLRMSTGRLKVFRSCQKWFDEFRKYRRNDKGRVVKKDDHLQDGGRYGIMGLRRAIVDPGSIVADAAVTKGRSTGHWSA
jgi:phage terminase large subunit-like protein